MMGLVLMLFSCRNEDLLQSEHKNHTRNNADVFKHVSNGGAFAKSGVDYISILEDYNDDTHFLAAMPDQEGMPIWEKMQVVDSEDATALAIPLTSDGNSLSSLIYVMLNDENRITGTKNVTNENLKNIIYDNRYSKIYREGIMNSFIQMDYAVFGNDAFCNIPEDLFVGRKDENNRLFYGGNSGVYTSTSGYDETGKIVYITAIFCTTFFHCTHHGGGDCDRCFMCETSFCTTSTYTVFVDDPMGSPFPSGNGGGGGATPNPNSPNTPPKDPCIYSEQVFYRMKPACNSIPGEPGDGLEDPCEKIKIQRNDPIFNEKIDSLQNNTSLKKETGFIQKNSGSYVYKNNASATDEANTLALPLVATNTYIKGFMHTHVNDYYYTDADGYTKPMIGVKIFSPSDVIYFMKLLKVAKNAGRPLSNVYGIMVASLNNYQIRFTGNATQIKEFTPQQETKLNDDFAYYMKKKIKKSKDLEFGLLKFLEEKMGISGVILYRMNTDGTTTEIQLNLDKSDTTENNCPI